MISALAVFLFCNVFTDKEGIELRMFEAMTSCFVMVHGYNKYVQNLGKYLGIFFWENFYRCLSVCYWYSEESWLLFKRTFLLYLSDLICCLKGSNIFDRLDR